MRYLLAATAAAIALTVTGCGGTGSETAKEPSATNTDEASSHLPEICPERLPIGDDPGGHGFGVDEWADESPSLLPPEEAWTCRYDPVDAGQVPDVGTTYEWVRAGEADPVPESKLPDLTDALENLAPFEGEFACTADLGPRWMVVYVNNGDLTGVVVDDYGCREVRLTDEPFITPGRDGPGPRRGRPGRRRRRSGRAARR